jgi:hypothetical protein
MAARQELPDRTSQCSMLFDVFTGDTQQDLDGIVTCVIFPSISSKIILRRTADRFVFCLL